MLSLGNNYKNTQLNKSICVADELVMQKIVNKTNKFQNCQDRITSRLLFQ